MQKIIAVQFEDGTIASVDDMQVLVRYISDFNLQQSYRALAADKTIDWPARARVIEARQVDRIAKKKQRSDTNSRNAKGPKKPVSKAELLAFEASYANPKYADIKRGWKAAACQKFRIARKTLDARIEE